MNRLFGILSFLTSVLVADAGETINWSFNLKQMFVVVSGCMKHGTHYEEGAEFTLSHVRYRCSRGNGEGVGKYSRVCDVLHR